MPQQITKLAEGVEALFLSGDSFNTTLVSFNFYMPLKKETVARNALLPEVIATCSREYPDYLKLNYRLTALYGADVVASASKVGNCICLKFTVSSINDRFTFDNERVMEESVELLQSLIFRPKTENGAFSEEDLKILKIMSL